MNINNIQYVLLYSTPHTIIKSLYTSKLIKSLINEYFWKLLCERYAVEKINEIEDKSWYEKYKILYDINILSNKMDNRYSISELLTNKSIDLTDNQIIKIIKYPSKLQKLLYLKTIYIPSYDLAKTINLENIKVVWCPHTYRLWCVVENQFKIVYSSTKPICCPIDKDHEITNIIKIGKQGIIRRNLPVHRSSRSVITGNP